MSGLNLYAGGMAGARAGGGTGNYSPLTPASAAPPSSSIGNQAFGIDGSGSDFSNNIAWIGSITVGVIAVVALAYLWWSLPR
jgi:hypothetical protein